MKTDMIRGLAVAVALSFGPGVMSQGLQKEITVRHDDVPELREVSKINIDPKIVLPAMETPDISYSVSPVRVGVPPTVGTLEPAAYADSIYTTPYRGYASIGYMPMYNLGASAGYKILDTDHTRVNAWMQFNGSAYKGDFHRHGNEIYVRRNTATIGSSLHQAVGRNSFIDAGVDYTFDRFNVPFFRKNMNQTAHRVNVSAMWSMAKRKSAYGAGVFYRHFGYANTVSQMHTFCTPVRENNYGIDGYMRFDINGRSAWGVNMTLSMISDEYESNRHMGSTEPWVIYNNPDSKNHGLLKINPYYRYSVDKFMVNLGAAVDLSFNAGKAVHIAPAVTAVYRPGDFVKVFVKAGGGVVQNTLGSLFDVTRFSAAQKCYENSNIPISVNAGVNIGSWKGFSAELSVEYAGANDWLMPDNVEDAVVCFGKYDMRGYKLHVSAGYNYRNIVDVKLSYESAPQKPNRGYYLWRDRARTVAGAQLRVTPIKPLDIMAGWEYRGSRSYYMYTPDNIGFERRPLGCISNLRVGALYWVNTQWSVFATGENLLNNRYNLIGNVPAQGVTGMVGASYKF